MTAPGKTDPPLRRSLGQHHLRRAQSATPAVDFLDVSGRTVIEVGPGGGVLTRLLLERGASRVIACELDPSWAFALRRRLADRRLRLAIGDACDLDYERAPVAARIAGNLPYNVATRIIARVLERAPIGLRAAFLVQREVADRLTAAPGDGAYGALTVLTRARAAASRLAVVMPGSFVPPPAVTSAFVGLERIEPPIAEEEWVDFKALVRTAFSRRRKTLLNNLATVMERPAAAEAISTLELPPKIRAEALGLQEFVELFRAWELLKRI
ncbi:MAG: 16S rRNA (adenine(1518)-N(6)/adenine(1519)-N(6))-dimethyltransferase RsmA [bacterium]|nr:16S rRNA (adenine(1518)-N(6)/adenine(1519)-N(6))-dimethyltransferase RsmA [bacterium]